jgi:hypothetical protein
MADLADELLLEVLKACARSSPDPLYPGDFAAYSGLDRALLDKALDHLRLRELARLTDWVQGKGQGYALTSQGALVLQNPALLRKPHIPDRARAVDAPPDRSESPWERGEAVREALLNPRRPVVCMTLLTLNLIMFAVGMYLAWRQGVVDEYLSFRSGNPNVNQIRRDLGALDPHEVLILNQWWRILAYAFVHGGLIHLIMNMYFLYSLGPLVETISVALLGWSVGGWLCHLDDAARWRRRLGCPVRTTDVVWGMGLSQSKRIASPHRF